MEYWKILVIVIVPSLAILGTISFLDTSDIETISPKNTVVEVSEDSIPLRIGTVHRDAQKMIERFQPSADYLAKNLSDYTTKYHGKVIITKTPMEMEILLKQQEIDLFYDSPLITYSISENSGSVPFLISWKENVENYHSVFFVKSTSMIDSLDDFGGKTIAFQSPDSTTGYLLPVSHLSQNGLSLGDDANSLRFVFSYDDENTPNLVIDGKADIGVTSNIDFEDFPEGIKSQLVIVEKTIDVPRYIVSHRSELNSDTVSKIRSILLEMNQDSEGKKILEDFKETKKYSELENTEKFTEQMRELYKIIQ
ncbi:hypothetical protein C6988_00575 [Nitrosopumilus sp. b1]|uniref:phosphate/phosphite/phosphonate ABC transporter substrate-binding protein n=1 Tax=Nitrosopumilus sp. b1 TaxID=2109907 RepID=UPI0015F3A705|nr:phosphate/phosphite/phosphonate ABC transporter substrate-binding protein [Nitrosopumilus sp. b1]KAF6243942.1 hypothetical protein C6988_00575 [Nitrosopumilus sp. b1]